MYLFIAIILIAELIIATNVICLIQKLDKKVVNLSNQVVEARPKLDSALLCLKESVSKFVTGVHNLCVYAEKRTHKYITMVIQNVLMYALLYFLKGRSKRCVSALQLAFSLKDGWDKACNS